jgi:hypothetical protein
LSNINFSIDAKESKFSSKNMVQFEIIQDELLNISSEQSFYIYYPSKVLKEKLDREGIAYVVFKTQMVSDALKKCDVSINEQRKEAQKNKVEFDKPTNRLKRFFDGN